MDYPEAEEEAGELPPSFDLGQMCFRRKVVADAEQRSVGTLVKH